MVVVADRCKCTAHTLKILLSGLAGTHAVRAPFEQADPELRLEARDLIADAVQLNSGAASTKFRLRATASKATNRHHEDMSSLAGNLRLHNS